jgi:hypothetical protein
MDNESDAEVEARQQRRWNYAWIISTFLILGSGLFTFAVKNNFFGYGCIHRTSLKNVCIGNLKQIDGAKSTWALENKKPPGAVVVDGDLFGRTLYIRDKPQCPSGGTYSLRRTGQKPRCTIPEHII